jgi:hypothetical protein
VGGCNGFEAGTALSYNSFIVFRLQYDWFQLKSTLKRRYSSFEINLLLSFVSICLLFAIGTTERFFTSLDILPSDQYA